MLRGCFLFAFLVLVMASTASAQTTLRWKFTKGQTFAVECSQKTEVEKSVNNKPKRAYLELGMKLAWQVDEVDDKGTASITQTITQLAIKTTAPDAEPVIYDSESTAKPIGAAKEIAAGVKPLLGTKFVVKMDARGDVTSAKLSEEAKKALEELPDSSKLKPLLVPEKLAEMFRLSGGPLPEKALNANDRWPNESTVETPYGKLLLQGEFTFSGEETVAGRKLAKIEHKGTGKLDPKANAAIAFSSLQQTKTGTLLFDAAAGSAVSSTTKVQSKSVRPFRDTQVQVKIDGTTTITFAAK